MCVLFLCVFEGDLTYSIKVRLCALLLSPLSSPTPRLRYVILKNIDSLNTLFLYINDKHAATVPRV